MALLYWCYFSFLRSSVLPIHILATAQYSSMSTSLTNIPQRWSSPPSQSPSGILIFPLVFHLFSEKTVDRWVNPDFHFIIKHISHSRCSLNTWLPNIIPVVDLKWLTIHTCLKDLQHQTKTCCHHCHQRLFTLFSTSFLLAIFMCSSVYTPSPYQIFSPKCFSHQLKSWFAILLCCGQTFWLYTLPFPVTWREEFLSPT